MSRNEVVSSWKRKDDINILEAIIDNTQTRIAYFDNGFRFSNVNRSFVAEFGINKEHLIGYYCFDLFPDPELEANFIKARDTGQVMVFRAYSFKNRPDKVWDWSLTPVRDKQGKNSGFIWELTETTDQLLSHQKLEESLNKIKIMNYQLNMARIGAERRAAELAATFRAMGEVVVIYDIAGNVMQVNSVATVIFGFDPVGLTRKVLIARLLMRYADGAEIRVEDLPSSRALRGERVCSEFLLVANARGENCTILASAAPLIIGSKIAGVVVTSHDITEQEKLHTQLELEQTRLDIILEQMPSGVVIVQASSGKLIIANEQATQILKIPLNLNESYEQLLALKAFHMNGQAYPATEWPLIRTIINGEEIEIHHQDGSVSIILVSSTPVWDRENELIAAVSVFSDITCKKQIELARQLQQIIEFLPDAIFVLDQDRKVVAWNRAIELLTGVAKSEIIGKGNYAHAVPFYGTPRPTLVDLCWEKEIVSVKEESHIEVEGDTFCTEVYVPALNQGRGCYLTIKATPLKDNQGRVTGAIASIRDKTRQHEMEEESFKAQKIESIGILAGGIAHDFNNFLAGILANVQLVKMKLAKGLDAQKALSSIEETISKAADLTRQLLAFSKGGAPIKKTTLLKDLLYDTTEFILRGSKSRCIFSIAGDLWPVEADTGQISQVISNLIINVDQAMSNGGILQLTAQNITIDQSTNLALKPGKYILIIVSDQGIGIAKENLKKIFDPYFTTKTKGNGLGLTTSYAIVNNHNGFISVESQVGIGTSFYVYLPATADMTVYSLSEKRACLLGKGRVLLMDDEDTIRNAAGEMLSQIGYQVFHARDGKEAIKIYLEAGKAGSPIDLVIMDLTIPGGLGGKETIFELKKHNPVIKAIVSSGYSNDPVMSNYREYGFSGVVAKPYKIEELSLVLQQVISEGNGK